MKDESFDCAGEAPLVIDENGEQRRNLRAVVLPKIAELPPDATGKETVCITGFYTVRLDNYFKEKNLHTVEATFMKRYDGQSVDSEETPIEGELNGVALVK